MTKSPTFEAKGAISVAEGAIFVRLCCVVTSHTIPMGPLARRPWHPSAMNSLMCSQPDEGALQSHGAPPEAVLPRNVELPNCVTGPTLAQSRIVVDFGFRV